MKIIEITESKLHKMSDMLEEMLMLGGKMMTCLSSLSTHSEEEDSYNRNKYYDEYKDSRAKKHMNYEDESPYSRMVEKRNRYGSF